MHSRIRIPGERLLEHFLPSSVVPEEFPSESTPGAGRGAGARSACSAAAIQRLHVLLKTSRYAELRAELARAELARELPELYALSFHAVLAMAEGSGLAGDYLEMAEAAAASPYELAVIAEHLATYDLLRGDPVGAAARCVVTLERGHQTEGLWIKLLLALHRLGEVETIDAMLRGFARLPHEDTAHLVTLLASEPELHAVRARTACRPLLDRRAAG
jgi:hypothetical protein